MMPQVETVDIADKLRNARLRPTRQRLSLAKRLFCGHDRHFTAEELHAEAASDDVSVSLATVYNTLHQFTQAGLLREVAAAGHKSYFDTNTSNHHHFFIESEGRLVDIPGGLMTVMGLPEAPEGKKIGGVDIIVRLSDV